MSLEIKEIYVGTLERKKEEIKLRQNFGWEFLEDKHIGRSHALYIVLERDSNMLHYSELASLENEYDELKKQLKVYYPITDSPEMFLLIFVFVFPFVFYCIYKSNQKKTIKENNEEIHRKMDETINKAKKVLYK